MNLSLAALSGKLAPPFRTTAFAGAWALRHAVCPVAFCQAEGHGNAADLVYELVNLHTFDLQNN